MDVAVLFARRDSVYKTLPGCDVFDIDRDARRKDGRRLRKGMAGWRPEVSKEEREHTPPQLAAWLVEVARRCAKAQQAAA